MNNRRRLVLTLGGALSIPRDLFAQAKKSPVVIGWLSLGIREQGGRSLDAFKEGLVALGWKEGVQFVIEPRWADGQAERYSSLAQELAARKPAVIVTTSHFAARHANKAAPNVPIVQATGTDPVPSGLAASLARPGGWSRESRISRPN